MLPGINQVNVNPKVGLTFAGALRAFLRQDPDVIMVGEIRDLETAEIAIKAAQTGHLVLSTLHTNDAPKTLTRLVDMGVKPYAIATSVSLIIAQRLARRLCNSCKAPMKIPAEALKKEGFGEEEIANGLQIFQAVGCSNCTDGYKGRTGIYQVMPVSEEIGRIIMAGGNVLDIKAAGDPRRRLGPAPGGPQQGAPGHDHAGRDQPRHRRLTRLKGLRAATTWLNLPSTSRRPSSGKARTRRATASRDAASPRTKWRCAPTCAGRASPRPASARNPQLFKSEGKVTAEDIALFAASWPRCSTPASRWCSRSRSSASATTSRPMQKLVLAIKSDIETGNSLHQALAKHPLYFDDLFVNLVEAGEHAGALETVLDKIATYKEKTEALKKKIKKALFYPAAVLAVAVIVTVILLLFVIPQFESLFKGFGADLPAFTQFVVDMSRWMQAKGWMLLIIVGGVVFTFSYFYKRSRPMRQFIDQHVAADPGHRADPAQSRPSRASRARSRRCSPPACRWSRP